MKIQSFISSCILIFSFALHGQEMSKANLDKLSKIPDTELFQSLLLVKYKTEALSRRNEAFDGIPPQRITDASKTTLYQMVEEAKKVNPLYKKALLKLGSQKGSLVTACKELYKFKMELPVLLNKTYFDSIALKFNPYNENLIRAQAWTRLQLARNFYINSIASFTSGEIHSNIIGMAAKCFADSRIYEDMAYHESRVLSAIQNSLKIIGQPGIKETPPSKLIAKKFMQEEAYWKQVATLTEVYFTTIIEETVYFYSGLGIIKESFETISMAHKAYFYLYPMIKGGIKGALATMKKGAPEKFDSANLPARNVKAFSERIKIYLPFGFQIDEEDLDKQVEHALEMEKILFHERYDLREESNKLCGGRPCTNEQASKLLNKLARNNKEIQFVMRSRKF